MGKKTKIDWCDSTWNPVTGCLHGCEYCYARRIAERFGGWCYSYTNNEACCEGDVTESDGKNHVLDEKPIDAYKGCVAPYPFGFDPTFHRYKLDEPQHWKKPRTIFVCSMADLFGDWVPDEWIEHVFQACEAAPQHRYLFLTKNPGRFCGLHRKGILREGEQYWYGATFDHSNFDHPIQGRRATLCFDGKMVHDAGDFYYAKYPIRNRFVSFEPLMFDIGGRIGSTGADWHIIGAETGSRKEKVITKREWVEHIVKYSDDNGIPVFMKESLRDLMGDDFKQQYPWDDKREGVRKDGGI